MPALYAANKSNVLIDGEAIESLQSIAFRVITEREDIRSVGTDERINVVFGLRTVQGELVVRSAAVKLDELLRDRAKFQLVASLKEDENGEARTYSFDDCYVEGKSFNMGASGSAVTTYVFTATRVREE
jgi:hypothetical protein